MRKIPAALAVLSLAAVGLAGCALPGSSSCARPDGGDAEVMDLITTSGSLGDEPSVDVYTPFHTDETSFEDAIVGDGTAIISDSQFLVADVSLLSGETGEVLVALGYEGDLSNPQTVAWWVERFPDIDDALHCATEGSRVVMALPPDGIVAPVAEGVGLGADESAIVVFDLNKVYLSKADGSNVYNTGNGLPTVVRAPDGRPGVIVPDGAPPVELAMQTIKKGDGEVVTGDLPVRVHYTGVLWNERTVFDSTWDGEPASLTLDGVVDGFAEALDGQTVGSQVMVVVPPDQGYGEQENGPVPANSTLVFVIDILGIDAAPTQ